MLHQPLELMLDLVAGERPGPKINFATPLPLQSPLGEDGQGTTQVVGFQDFRVENRPFVVLVQVVGAQIQELLIRR
jgi:hypothetical protein